MATASPFDAIVRDVFEALLTSTRELEAVYDEGAIAQKAAELALRLTRSGNAVAALGQLDRSPGRLYTAAAQSSQPLTDGAAAEVLGAAGFGHVGGENARGAVMGTELRAQGQVLGAIAVTRPSEYTDTERTAFEVFAAQASLALVVARRRDDQAINLVRVENAHEQAVEVLQSVSSHAARGENLNDFYRRLAKTVGELVGAHRVLFWRLGDDHMIAPIPGGYRIDPAILSRLKPTRCEPGRHNLASRVVFGDFVFRASKTDYPAEYAHVLETLGVTSAISVPWRAGEERLGLMAAYDSTRPGGFSREDTWVLLNAGLAAGLVWRLWHAQDDLRKSVERLTKVDGARQMLLKNMTTVVEKERKRFVSELHDDALQRLTAAELQVEHMKTAGDADEAAFERLGELLAGTESALRRLVFEVRPPSLEAPDGLGQSIRERIAMLTALNIGADLDLDLPAEMSVELRTMVFRQVAEAISNVERHSQATRVEVSLKTAEGGLLGVVRDNGRGFEVSERSNLPGHLGLLALRERALMAGGRYKIESRPGAGTRVEFWIPLEQ